MENLIHLSQSCKEVISIAWSVNERSEAKCCSEKERVKKKAKHKTLVGD